MQPKFTADTFFHIYNRGNNYEKIFLEEKNYSYFLHLLERYITPIAKVYAYCLIPNHFHLVLKFKTEEDLPDAYRLGNRKLHHAFSDMFNAYAKAINKSYNRRGSLFQKGLKRKMISDLNYFRDVILYVHNNPIRHGLEDSAIEYKHSSYNDILDGKSEIVAIVETIDAFDNLDNFIYCHRIADTFNVLRP